ncbi:cilia- and flagella-associated protein 97 [Nematolebias whitei]|uniref:cilia- and flagella-associated protein 97 n=1 Tax=Nematolebias whitei TaxID=451745 RepID=UPI001898EBD5|nr:cilia- and flagella-associated protein 97 [Nematolebias whitei]
MFNPSELEGEVDHSFFDSDCDEGREDGREKKEGKQSSKTPEQLPSKHTQDAGMAPSSTTERTRRHIDSEDESKLCSKGPSGTLLALMAEELEMDCVHTPMTNKTEEKALAMSDGLKRSREKSAGKPSHNLHPSLTLADADADSESSCSSQRSPTLPKTTKSSLRHGLRRTRVGSAGSRDLPAVSTDESDDTVTDVSPLSSPDISPPRSHLNHTEEGGSNEEEQERVPSSDLSSIHQEEPSHQEMDESSSFSLESLLEHKLVINCPGGRNRKNYSFTNDEVTRIDRENQRLLRELSRLSPAPRWRKAAGQKACMSTSSPLIHASHSALNRQREQRRIERENLAFLKRLERVKSTPGLRRSEQLADYQRYTGYLGAPSGPLYRTSVKRQRRSGTTSSGFTDPRPVSSRAAFTNTESSSTPGPRSKQLSAARPTWC